ncbi:MAG: hypothetical protein Q8L98_02170 [Chlamydiales bacterium]|nr:hypothetical protein [Chlamydiales bacterium]
MNRYLFITTFLGCSLFGYNNPCVDIHFSPYSGAENFLFLEKSLEQIDDLLFSISDTRLESLRHFLNLSEIPSEEQWLRKAKLLLFWAPFNFSCAVTQHEVFGHGYRVRDLGDKYAQVTGYGMYVVAGFTKMTLSNELTTSQMLTIDIAGLEADSILTNRLRMKWLNSGEMDGREFSLYALSSLTFTNYTWLVHNNPTSAADSWNDISSFLFYLHKTYPDTNLGYINLRNLALLNLLDPFLFSVLLSNFLYTTYGFVGPVPMFQIGPIEYLPSFRLALTPFGLQGYLENFFLINKIPTYFYVKWGKNGQNIYYGAGLENRKLIQWKSGALGLRFDIWHQPRVLFEQGLFSVLELQEMEAPVITPPLYPDSVLYEKITGAACSVISSYEPSRLPLKLFMQLGYKTDGYLPGEALRSAPLARGGISGRF